MNKKRFLHFVCALCALLFFAGISAHAEQMCISYGGLPVSADTPQLLSANNVISYTSEFADYLMERLNRQEAEIDVSHFQMTPEEFDPLYWHLLNDHPEMFHVGSFVWYYWDDNRIMQRVLPRYIPSDETMEERTAFYHAAVDEIAQYASSASTTIGKLLLINDYFCTHYVYDDRYYSEAEFENAYRSAEQLFRHQYGVCRAYTLAFKAVLDRLGIENTTARSVAMDHVWNMVRVDGEWYHIDVTWNDPTTASKLSARHNHFMLSDEGITESGHYSWLAGANATDSSYDDFFWRNINTAIPVNGSDAYYVETTYEGMNRYIKKWKCNDEEPELLYTYQRYGWYYNDFDPLFTDGSRLYYGYKDRLYSIDFSGQDLRLEFVAGLEDCLLVTAWRDDTSLQLELASTSGFDQIQLISAVTEPLEKIELPANPVEIMVGEKYQLEPAAAPQVSYSLPLVWKSEQSEIVTVAEDGCLEGIQPGVSRVGAALETLYEAECAVVVHSPKAVKLSSDLEWIANEAFKAIAAEEIVLPEGLITIGDRAFADNDGLYLVNIPKSVREVGENAFEHCDYLTLLCVQDSEGQRYAERNGLNYVLVPASAEPSE